MTPKLDTLQRIEIAEGVEIHLRLAGPVARGLAYLTDWGFKVVILLGGGILAGMVGALLEAALGTKIGEGVTTGLMIVFFFLIVWGYPIAFEVSPWNATPGKRMLGLRVARTSGAPITWHQAVTRNLLRTVDLLPAGGIVGLISCLVSSRFQRLGDLAADTVVVHAEPAVIRSGEKERWEGGDDCRPPVALTREEQGAILQFAERMNEWQGARAEELAGHIGALTRATGGDGVRRTLGIARWIRNAG